MTQATYAAAVLVVAMATVLVTTVTSSRVVTMSSCHAMLDGALISLESLQRTDGSPKYTVEGEGWNFTFNPCSPYNAPYDPHIGLGDQCHNVAMCRSRSTSGGDDEYFTMGIQTSARMMLKLVPTGSDELEESSEELPGEESSEEVPGEESSDELEDEEEEDDDDEEEDSEEEGEEEEKDEETDEEAEEDTEHITVSILDSITNTSLSGSGNSKTASGDVTLGREEPQNTSSVTRAPDEDGSSNTNVRASRHLQTSRPRGSQRGDNNNNNNKRRARVGRSRHRTREVSRVRREVSAEEKGEADDQWNAAERGTTPRRRYRLKDFVEEEDEEDGVPRLVIRFKGTRSQRVFRSYIVLSCAPELKDVDSGQFTLLSVHQRELFFELRHQCCCPGACVTPPEESALAAQRLTDMEDGAQHLWLVVVVNFAVIVMATIIGLVCCRKGGGNGPYNVLPTLHSSQTTLTSVESLRYQKRRKFFNRPPDFLEYSSSLHQKAQLPMLSNCVVHSREVDIGHRLGGGLFGDSYIGEWKDRRVAIKRFTVGVHQNQISSEDRDWMTREVGYLTRHRHKHLVTLLAICLDARQPHIINEYVDGGCVKDALKQNSIAFSMAQKIKMCLQAADGMSYLHSLKRPVFHRDLRCANLLLDKDEKIKIADYGITKLLQRLRHQCTGHEGCYCQKHQSALPASIRWTAPEVLQQPDSAEEGPGSVFTGACDVYSFGMLMWEMTTGLDPYEGVTDEKQLFDLVLQGARPDLEVLGSMGASAHFRELIRVCWEDDAGTRPLFKHVTMHLKSTLQNLNKTERSLSAMNDTNSYLKSALSVYKDLT